MNAFRWALLTACIWGVVPLLEKAGLAKLDPITGLFCRCVGVLGGMILLGLFIIRPHHITALNPGYAGLLVLGGFLASFVGQIFFYNGLKTGEASRVVPIAASYPLVSFVLGIVLMGESVNAVKLGGVALVVAGLWLLKAG